MHFLYANLAWGFLLVLLPALIHLIQRLRHRRVGWAAMQFLQASYRKHQRWVWLKQLLLMALRMLAVAACVAMLAQWVTQDQWLHWFGGQTIHHVVILDDSLSMDDRSQGGATAFDRAQQALRDLVATAQRSGQPQKLTLIRASRAALSEEGRAPSTGTASSVPVTTRPSLVDLQAVAIRPNMEAFREPTDEQSSVGWRVSQQAVGLVPALTLAADLLEGAAREERVLHVLSDFRQTDWEQTADVVAQLTRLQRADVAIHLIRCALEPDANLSITSLAADAGTQAAGVPLMMKVGVHNHSTNTLQRVPLKIIARAYATGNAGNEAPVQETELPNLILDQLAPGETIWRQFQVYFATPGDHVVEVALPNDALAADNRRWAILSLPAVESALIIDGDGTGRAAYYLQSIFEPGTRARTGIRPVVQPVRYLRDTNVDELLRYQAIYLLDVPALDDRSQTNLLEYLQQGGGVTSFVGPQISADFYTQAFERGWFPVPLAGQMEGPAARDPTTGSSADVVFGDHVIFRALFGQDNPFATAIRIRRYARTPESWTPPTDSGVEILARLRTGAPLALQRTVGKGHSVAFLTTLSPDWNNWALEPSFIVTLLQLHAYLTESQRTTTERLVGSRLELAVDSSQYKPSVAFATPTLSATPRTWSKAASAGDASHPQRAQVILGPVVGQPTTAEETEASGVYDAQMETLNGIVHHRRFALNVSPREGALAVAPTPELKQRLAPIDVQIRSAEQGLDQVASSDTSRWSLPLLTLLLVVLVVEQWLAYVWSYHPRPVALATGGVR